MISFFTAHELGFVVPLLLIMIMDHDVNSYHLVMYLITIMLRGFLFYSTQFST